jgi:hypothetical protein
MHENKIDIRVSCYAGYRGEENPLRFSLKDRQIEVIKIVDRWLAPDHRYFKIRGDDDAIYILRHDISTEQWELILYDCTQPEPAG